MNNILSKRDDYFRMRKLEEIEIEYKNKLTKIKIQKDIPNMTLEGTNLSTVPIGKEVEVRHWAAEELVDSGYAKYKDNEVLTFKDLSKIHWKETIPSSRQIPNLDENFYCKLRRFFKDLKNSNNQIDQRKDYQKSESISNEIINCRIKKIMVLASAQYKNVEILTKLTQEEKLLLTTIAQIIDKWRNEVLGGNGDGEYSTKS